MEKCMWRNVTSGVLVTLIFLGVSYSCPDGWYRDELDNNNRCFHYVPTPAAFNDAVESCRLITAKLATPLDILDTTILMNILQTKVDEQFRRNIWLNARRHPNGEWKSTESENTYLNWSGGYIRSSDDCIEMSFGDGIPHTKSCDHRSGFICETMKDSAAQFENCEVPSLLEHISVRIEGPVVQGTAIYPLCDVNYMFDQVVKSQPVFRCVDGEWDKSMDTIPECIVERCPELVIRHLTEITSGGVSYQSVRSFTCPRGTTFENREIMRSGNQYITVKCNRLGSWEGEFAHRLYNGRCIAAQTTPMNAADRMKFSISLFITLSLSLIH